MPLEHDQADIGTLHRGAALNTCRLYMTVHPWQPRKFSSHAFPERFELLE